MNINNNKFKYIMIFLGAIFVLLIVVIVSAEDNGKDSSIHNGIDIPVMPSSGNKTASGGQVDDKSLIAIVLDINESDKTMLLNHLDTQTRINYSYSGGTDIVNRYDETIAVSQLKIGEVVEAELSENRKLSRIKISDTEWEYQGVTGFEIDRDNQILKVGSEKYKYTDNTIIFNEGNITPIDKLDSIDVVTLKGREKQLDSIIVTSGHGYVRLDGTTFFEGGFVEIGSKIVQLITENMVVPVPAGDYTLRVTKGDNSGSKDISVGINEEIRVNLIEFQSEAVRLGTLSFKISPNGAKLMIDGVAKDYSKLVDVAYGLHKITITATGYETYTQTIDVQDIFKEYDITLIEQQETSASDKETSEKPSSKDTSETSTKATKATTPTTTYQTIDYNKLLDSLFGN